MQAKTGGEITAQDIQNSIRFTTFSATSSYLKLTSEEQRSLFFGFAPFGRKNLKIRNYGIDTMIRVAFGKDYDVQSYTWDEIAKMVNEKRKAWKN